MIWAKEEKKRFFHRPRMAVMTIYTVGLCLLSLAAFASAPQEEYRITLPEVEALIAEELMRQGAGDDVEVTIVGRRTNEIVRRHVPVLMQVVDLQADAANSRFQAVVGFATEADLDRPAKHIGRLTLSGRYDRMMNVPTVKSRLKAGDVIREEDIEWQRLPVSRVDRNAVLDDEELIGKSPLRGLSVGRAIRKDELQHPPIVFRRTPVQMQYQTEYISITAIGTAMQDGAMGEKIKVRNDDSGILLDARVVDRGRVEVVAPVIIN